VPQSRLFATWRIIIGFSGFHCFAMCSAFTTEAFMPDSARWIGELMRSGSVSPAISDGDARFWLFNNPLTDSEVTAQFDLEERSCLQCSRYFVLHPIELKFILA
jgi:hypothetical protein